MTPTNGRREKSRLTDRQKKRRAKYNNDNVNKTVQQSERHVKDKRPEYTFGTSSKAFRREGGFLLDITNEDAKEMTLSTLNDVLSFMNSPFIALMKGGSPRVGKTSMRGLLHIGIWMINVKHYSGGRVHILLAAHLLAEMGHKVTVVTDRMPPFENDFKYFQTEDRLNYVYGDETVRTDWLLKEESSTMDIVIASPRVSQAFSYAFKFNKPCAAILFETPNWVRQFRGGNDGTEQYWEEYKKDILNYSDFVLCNPGPTLEYASTWLREAGYEKPILPFPPAINTRAADSVLMPEKKNEITFIGRHLDFKCPDDVIRVAGQIPKEIRPSINFIGSHNENRRVKMNKVAKEFGVKIRFYSCIDDYEKFSIIKRSKAVVIPTKFEGFGMPPAEAIYCKTPAIVYELEVTKRIYKDSVIYAEVGNWKQMATKLKNLLKMPDKEYSALVEKNYRYMMNPKGIVPCHPYKIKKLFRDYFYQDYLSVAAGMIVLNGMDTIKTTLDSIYEDVDQIVIVEGIVEDYARVNPKLHKNYHSIDGTTEFLKKIKEYDYRGIIEVVTIDRAFKDKNEMQNEIAKRINKDVYIKVDADEVWKTEGIEYIRRLFQMKENLSMASIGMHHFWKGYDMVAVGGQWDSLVPRVWRWKKSYRHPEGVKGGFNYFIDTATGKKVDKYTCKGIAIGMKLVYHLGYCRDNEHIEGKINYYKGRGIERNVKNNYKDWKPGMPTNSTHPNGTTAELFKGVLPMSLDKKYPKRKIKDIKEVHENNQRMLHSPLLKKK